MIVGPGLGFGERDVIVRTDFGGRAGLCQARPGGEDEVGRESMATTEEADR
jgi:hypothetical protein